MSLTQAIGELANPYHAYVFGTAFWYFLRGMVRVIDPATVCGWFRPPIDGLPTPNDLELYTTRTDAFSLLALAATLLAIADAVALPSQYVGSTLVNDAPPKSKKPYARAIVVITILHHVATGVGAYPHWSRESHNTVAMEIGVWGNVFFTVLGVAALQWGLRDSGAFSLGGKKRA
ncbi:hypothetical protein CLAFUW4_00414 [Fulvia fulva]|uniref:Uncharacterized protein n=1 Tax=Passalora fulva TaxID=5499 RepID=A0A9Q8P419_PASFU|nr:uncharacterized protein CLAFUR5_00416 [Fulvia fulva]KAK4635150.1 hypothetical protein CLAFUR4_00414 [Fulvia fulva]KAK4638348.1 hypothetical protein CLAFUR0_00415 [Fulvia fulva]UJO12361.1 hypothetical protein CLAFUR5_00416 [Fulvia fulva]WPV09894.1 hypothetical protein CLAFUW4_00414 [Fulvia fulva]WPV23267.1 hypothetical protein CLAFUW7_00418 [Fulvia fulva]